MKIKLLLPALAALGLAASPAQAVMVAGWDFSQYVSDGFLSVDFDLNPATSLAANYSHLDPTFNAGAESAAFGRFHYDGQFGSTPVNVDLSFTEPLLPSTGSLASNITAPVDIPNGQFNQFDSFTILIDEGGQDFANPLKMQVTGPLQIVFRATVESLALTTGSGWSMSFGGVNLFAGQQANVGIEFSSDGVNYAPLGQVVLDPVEKVFDTAALFGAVATESTDAFFRLSLTGTNLVNVPAIDNVAIFASALTVVPEPGTALLLLSGLAGLAASGRRRA